MKCFMCKAEMEDKNTNFMLDLNNCIVLIKNVPSKVCTQCGEISYDTKVVEQLEKIKNNVQKDIAEIAIINYSGKVA